MNICTIVAKNYIAQARVLAESFREHHPDGTCTVFVIDDVDGYIDASEEPFELVTTAALDIEEFENMTTIYGVLELSTAVKPWLLRYLLNERQMESLVYLDPDLRIFDAMDELEPLMRDHGLVLIPHVTTPIPRDGEKPTEADILMAGTYNLGFIGVNNDSQTHKLLDWWSERLGTDCLVAPERGYFVDQRWMDFVHGLADDFYVLRDPAYNVAYWNLHGRDLTFDDGRYYVDGRPLRFFHFSGYDPENRHLLSKHQSRIKLSENPALIRICNEYAEALIENGYEDVKDWPYTYDTLPNGIKVDQFMRRLYREGKESGELMKPISEPEGARNFVRWLNQPARAGAHAGITRYLYEIFAQREDLRAAFPGLDGPNGARFADWSWHSGRTEVPIPDQFLPSAHKSNGSTSSGHVEQKLGVNVAGYFRSELGVGEAARQIITALDAERMPLAPVGVVAPRSRQGHEFASFSSFDPPFPINLICVNADVLPTFVGDVGSEFFEGRYSIGMWWWEVNEFPGRWRSSFKHLDEIWVGTQHIADALSQVSPIPVTKVTVPVSMPQTAQLERSTLGLPEDFVFLFVFDYNSVFERKNPMATVEAFKAEFQPGSGASLVLKSINHEYHSAEHERLRMAASEHPDIHVIDRYVSVEDKNAMIASCDCYVSLHRSEGFGLTLAEAMYLGKPVIATAYSGNLDYMTPENSYLVDYNLKPIGDNAKPYPATGQWADPDIGQAAGLMRYVFDNPKEARQRAARGAAEIRRTHSPKTAGRTIAKRLRWIEARSSQNSPATPKPPRELRPLNVEGVAKRIKEGPTVTQGSRFAALGRFIRHTMLRLIWPSVAHQQAIDEQLLTNIRRVNASLNDISHRLESQSATAHAETLALLREQNKRIGNVSGELDTVHSKTNAINRLETRHADVLGALNQQNKRLNNTTGELEALRPKIKDADRLVAETRAIPYMSDSPFELFEEPAAGLVSGYMEHTGTTETFNGYGAFEDIFRGPEDFIRDRQRRYLEVLGDREPVLDAGCGRGEFLDLLREQGIEYVGIDIDSGMVERCRAKGHEQVKLIDVNSYLEGLADGSLGAIFCAQVIEHLPYGELLSFLELSRSKLKSGGLLIAETVNPHSVPAMKTFWVDLTHQHPIFPEVALTLCRIHGFDSAYVFHPNGTGNVEVDRYQTGEYAVVAKKAPDQSFVAEGE